MEPGITPAAAAVHKAAQAQIKLADSAETLTDSASAQEDSADRRTRLAADRTVLAAERTYAAWMRTGFAALASGIGAKALLDHHVPGALSAATTIMLELFAIFCFGAAVWRQLDRGAPPPRPDVKVLPAWLLIVFSVFLSVVALVAGIGFALS